MTKVEEIREKVKELKTKEDKIELKDVYPSLIEEALGKFKECPNINYSWECYYWASTDKYAISGTMYYGTAEISLEKEE